MKKNRAILLLCLAVSATFPVATYALKDVGDILKDITSLIMLPLLLGLATIMFIWAGFLFVLAKGEPAKIDQAKKAVIWGIAGIIVGLLAFSITGIISQLLGV